jgi:PD-(D/E)XK nuclease superfamily
MNNIKPTKGIIKDNIDYSKVYSPSRLKMFEQCPKQYYFTYLDPIYSKLKNKLKTIPENIWKFQTVGKAVHNAITLFYYLPLDERICDNLLRQLKTTWESEVMRNKKPPLGKWGGFKTVEEERESYKEAQLC